MKSYLNTNCDVIKPTEDDVNLHLPTQNVFDYKYVLRPRKPLIPEQVVTNRCQNLDRASVVKSLVFKRACPF